MTTGISLAHKFGIRYIVLSRGVYFWCSSSRSHVLFNALLAKEHALLNIYNWWLYISVWAIHMHIESISHALWHSFPSFTPVWYLQLQSPLSETHVLFRIKSLDFTLACKLLWNIRWCEILYFICRVVNQ